MKEFFWKEKGIYYRINEFKSNRLTLVFVHGVSGSSSAWFPYERIFEDKYNILNYDIRGHGNSKKFFHYKDYEIKYFVNDLYDLISYLNIPKFILISNSLGGLIALEYLKLHRKNVIANIFTSPEIYLNEGIIAKIIRLILKMLTWLFTILPFNPSPRGHVDYNKHLNSTDWNISRNWADMKNTTPRVHFYTLRQSFKPKQKYFLEKINVPTLIMHGEKDSMVSIKKAIKMKRKIKNSEFIMIKNIDHNTAHNAVKIISEAIESFIKKNKRYFNTFID
ncbi:MAG: alpha/beta fold hydrolase [Xanthomonadaceae bacterium]|nr:alpha/beta fold hydrolase [Rhodospirillaceae bacterium]NIA18068.1 alpha/beta fold hydrolase [Xanthomonadaceae bacterium]